MKAKECNASVVELALQVRAGEEKLHAAEEAAQKRAEQALVEIGRLEAQLDGDRTGEAEAAQTLEAASAGGKTGCLGASEDDYDDDDDKEEEEVGATSECS